VRERILAISAASALLTCLIAFLVSRSISLRIRRLKLLAESFPGGAGLDRPVEDSRDELASLERSLAGIAIELQRLLDRLRYESARREAILSGMAEGVLAVNQSCGLRFATPRFCAPSIFAARIRKAGFLLELIRDPGLHELLRSVLATGEPKKLRFKLSSANARVFE